MNVGMEGGLTGRRSDMPTDANGEYSPPLMAGKANDIKMTDGVRDDIPKPWAHLVSFQ